LVKGEKREGKTRNTLLAKGEKIGHFPERFPPPEEKGD
jgi:hypothetical protein